MHSELTDVRATAHLWNLLKSIDHAINRALELHPPQRLAPLDKDRLSILAEILRDSIHRQSTKDSPNETDFSIPDPQPWQATSKLDLIGAGRRAHKFETWLEGSKIGPEKKLQRLSDRLNRFVADLPAMIYPKDLPREELEVLSALIRQCLIEARASNG